MDADGAAQPGVHGGAGLSLGIHPGHHGLARHVDPAMPGGGGGSALAGVGRGHLGLELAAPLMAKDHPVYLGHHHANRGPLRRGQPEVEQLGPGLLLFGHPQGPGLLQPPPQPAVVHGRAHQVREQSGRFSERMGPRQAAGPLPHEPRAGLPRL